MVDGDGNPRCVSDDPPAAPEWIAAGGGGGCACDSGGGGGPGSGAALLLVLMSCGLAARRRHRRRGRRLALLALLLLGACDITPFRLGGGHGAGADGGSGGDGGAGPADARDGDARGPCVVVGPDDQCDEIDNDCNGIVNDAFDKANDGNNCGTCGNRCVAPGALLDCEQGSCVFVNCQPGFVDLDPADPGCEYRCPLFPPRSEDCNGVDDDCDGLVDEVVNLPAPPAGMCRTTPGTPCAGTSMVCDSRGSPPVTRWYCAYAPEVEFDPTVPNGIVLQETLCDGEDGDCDGVADDAFADLGQECDNGAKGICRDVGVRSCDPADPTQTYCDLTVPPDPSGSPAAETCNGLDDNCDGIVDNPTGADRVVDDMVHVTASGLDFYMYTYEASRADATSAAAGVSGARACSRPSVVPWGGVTFAAASAACAISNKRLCTADEYLAACAGAAGSVYPYGDTFDAAACNTEPHDGIAGGADDDILLPTGDLAQCTSADGIFDLSGNLKEWTDEITGQTIGGTDIAVLRGGGYATPAFGATCSFRSSRAAVTTILPAIGFRCCSDSAP